MINSRSFTHKDAIRIHVLRRGEERFGFPIDDYLQDEFVRMIQDGEAEFIKRVSHSKTIWGIKHNMCNIKAVYSSSMNMILTVLTKKMKC